MLWQHRQTSERGSLVRTYLSASSSSYVLRYSELETGKRSNLPLMWVTKHVRPQAQYLVQGASNASLIQTECLEEAKLLFSFILSIK